MSISAFSIDRPANPVAGFSGVRGTIHPLVSEFPSNLVWKYGHGKMGLPSGLQAGRQWRGRVRIPLAPAFDQVRKEPEPFVPVS
jgi:ribulose 1,5-bisphosphate carboxylase large subunit-like protein